MRSRHWLVAVALAGATRVSAAQDRPVELVADPGLGTVAVAESDSAHPTIRYNPVLLQRVGRELATFIVVHETAHIRLGHTYDRQVALDDSGSVTRLRAIELAADCAAARVLAAAAPDVLARAIAWLRDAGDTPTPDGRPNGTERARQLAACSVTMPVQLVSAPPSRTPTHQRTVERTASGASRRAADLLRDTR